MDVDELLAQDEAELIREFHKAGIYLPGEVERTGIYVGGYSPVRHYTRLALERGGPGSPLPQADGHP